MVEVYASDAAAARREARRERAKASAPERFAKPRMMLLVAVFALVAFGLLMIYSSSSIVALTSETYNNDPTYFVVHQLIYVAVGSVAAAILSLSDYHLWSRTFLPVVWAATVVLLGMVLFSSSGTDAYGATRWVSIGGSFTLQPSEFAKVTIVLSGAYICQEYFEDMALDLRSLLLRAAALIIVPLGLILVQPDKGTTMICAVTIVVMLYLSGVSGHMLCTVGGLAAAAFVAYSMMDSYSRQRILTMLNPWADPYGTGYQLIEGFYAFGSGGLFGVGIGAGRQKYSYLPMAYNDFIYAVIGEECGLVGTLGVLAGFAVVIWAGLRIARYAPDLSGRLIAAGSVSMLAIQLFINICGVLGIVPLSGKPVPFISYGGSSVIASLMLVGLVISVSRSSRLEETEFDRRRQDMSLTSRSDLRVLEGGALPYHNETSTSDVGRRARIRTSTNGRQRIDLGPSAAERLRPRT